MYNNFIIGIFGGMLVAILLIGVACVQMWPKWKAWGFVRAKNAEERTKIASYQEKFKNSVYKYLWIGGFVYGVYTVLTWFINENNLGWAAIGFIIFIPGYLSACFILDYLTRNHIIKL